MVLGVALSKDIQDYVPPCEQPTRMPGGCLYADQAAEQAVRQVFAILGVNVTDPAAVEKFRRGLRAGQFLQDALDKGVIIGVGIITAGLLGALWFGLVEKIKH